MATEEKKKGICEFPNCDKETKWKNSRFCNKHFEIITKFHHFIKKGILPKLWGKKINAETLAVINDLFEAQLNEINKRFHNRGNSCRNCIHFKRIGRWGDAFMPQGVCTEEAGCEPYLSSSKSTSCEYFEDSYDLSDLTEEENLWNALVKFYAKRVPNPIMMAFARDLPEGAELKPGLTSKDIIMGSFNNHDVLNMILKHRAEMDKEIEQIRLGTYIRWCKPKDDDGAKGETLQDTPKGD